MLLASGGSFIYVSTIHVLGDAMSEKSNSRGLFLGTLLSRICGPNRSTLQSWAC